MLFSKEDIEKVKQIAVHGCTIKQLQQQAGFSEWKAQKILSKLRSDGTIPPKNCSYLVKVGASFKGVTEKEVQIVNLYASGYTTTHQVAKALTRMGIKTSPGTVYALLYNGLYNRLAVYSLKEIIRLFGEAGLIKSSFATATYKSESAKLPETPKRYAAEFEFNGRIVKFTQAQIDVVHLYAVGFTTARGVAQFLSENGRCVTRTTIINIFNKGIYPKLGVKSIPEVIQIFQDQGLIPKD